MTLHIVAHNIQPRDDFAKDKIADYGVEVRVGRDLLWTGEVSHRRVRPVSELVLRIYEALRDAGK